MKKDFLFRLLDRVLETRGEPEMVRYERLLDTAMDLEDD